MRIIVNNNYTYEAPDTVKLGDTVELPTPDWLIDAKGPTWQGKVTSLVSPYEGQCISINRVIKPRKKK